MSNTITNVATSNTFLQWLTSTQTVIDRLNRLTEGGYSETFVSNTNIKISGDLTVGGNISLDAIGFDDLYVSGNTSVTGNTILGNAYIDYSNQETANITLITGSYGNFIDTAHGKANAGSSHANSGYNHANAAFITANTAITDALAFSIALG